MAGRNPTAKRSGATTRAMTARDEAEKSIEAARSLIGELNEHLSNARKGLRALERLAKQS